MNDRVYASIQIRASEWEVMLIYRHTPCGGSAEAITQTVRLESTPCTLSGRRRWFACPACGRRVAVIYGAGRLFACRQCKGLAYGSQNESSDDRAARHADRIRKRLGWPVGIFNPSGDKPKGMHWRTYWGLKAKHDTLVQLALEGISRKLCLLSRTLEHARDNLAGRR